MSAPGVGLYSISVREPDVPALLTWAAGEGIPFVHLRGGPRGFDLGRRDLAALRRWRRIADDLVPITGVTADVDLADLLTEDHTIRSAAREQTLRLADAAAALGAGWLRLLARIPLTDCHLSALREGVVPLAAVPLLVELHHPDWLAPTAFAAMEEVLDRCPQIRLLADTAQLCQRTRQTPRWWPVGFPAGGQENSPLTDSGSPRGWAGPITHSGSGEE
ncbi:MAG: hypothetical protein HYR62_03515, partial [Actinobacteria bacterium]|nr:hypothetical protein [Actinomycetota bacterium]